VTAWRQQDYILRMIEQISAAIRRALQLRVDGSPEGAVEELRAAEAALLGPAAPLVPQLDAHSAVNVVGDPQRLALWARLLYAESETRSAMDETETALALRARALFMARAAVAKDEGIRELIGDLLRELET
jgi:hypothetical protein